MSARVVGVIPARWGSTRFPGKSLAPVAGKPLLAWVIERARQARRLDEVLVATDDERIAAVAAANDAEAVMTRPEHPSGTDRIAEAIEGRAADVVINIQGDEPLMDPALVDRVAERLASDANWDMATAATAIAATGELHNPNVVKVVRADNDAALYFSRAPIPFVRGDSGRFAPTSSAHWRHIGLYGYRRAFLERLVRTPPHPLEELEKLEQLRALTLGGRILVLETADAGIGVDSPEDVPRAEALLRQAGLV